MRRRARCAAAASVATDALIDLGCDLAEVDRQSDAEWCFRRAADLGDALGSFNLAIALRAQSRGARRWPPTRPRSPAACPTPGATWATCSRSSATWPARCAPTAAPPRPVT